MGAAERFLKVRESLPTEVQIQLAAKTRSLEEINDLIAAGASFFGHNYVQEMEVMVQQDESILKRATWHLIGHLQTNKINKTIGLFHGVQTVDSMKKAKAIASRLNGSSMDLFLEVNIAEEENKNGFPPQVEEILPVIQFLSQQPGCIVKGLMTMGPAHLSGAEQRPFFKATKVLMDCLNEKLSDGQSDLRLEELSMGMSDSYQVAVEEGATIVRIGSHIFGPRARK